MYEAPDLSGYPGGYGGADAASAASITAGTGGDSGPSLAAQADAYLTGSDGGRPGLLAFTPAGTIAAVATSILSGLFGADSIGPMGSFPGDAVSVSNDNPPPYVPLTFPAAMVPVPAPKIDAGPPLPSTGVQTLSAFTDGLVRGMAGQTRDPRADMSADYEMLYWRAGQLAGQAAPAAPPPAVQASPYGPLQLEVTKGPSILPLLIAAALLVLAG